MNRNPLVVYSILTPVSDNAIDVRNTSLLKFNAYDVETGERRYREVFHVVVPSLSSWRPLKTGWESDGLEHVEFRSCPIWISIRRSSASAKKGIEHRAKATAG